MACKVCRDGHSVPMGFDRTVCRVEGDIMSIDEFTGEYLEGEDGKEFMDVWSNTLHIAYCPFCGEKLEA